MSLYAMLERFDKIYANIAAMFVKGAFDKGTDMMFVLHCHRTLTSLSIVTGTVTFVTPDEQVVLKRYLCVLNPIADFVEKSEGEQYSTIAAAPVLYLRCLRALGVAAGDDANTCELKVVACEKLEERLGSLVAKPNLALAAAALHPAYGHLSFVDNQVVIDLFNVLVVWAIKYAPPKAPGLISVAHDEASVKHLLDLVHQFFVNQDNRPTQPNGANDPLFVPSRDQADTKVDELAFWRANSIQLAPIAHLARIVHSVPASSAPSERVFSSAGFIVDERRTRLSEHNVTMLTVVRDHLVRIGNDAESTKEFYVKIQEKLDTLKVEST